MDPQKVLYIAGAGVIAGGSAFVLSRLALREGVRQEIEATDAYAKAQLVAQGLGLFGVNLGVPTPAELATAIVPLFSTVSPYEAAEDIKRHGRKSKYWPKGYKQSDIPYELEMAIITAAMLGIQFYYQKKGEWKQLAAS